MHTLIKSGIAVAFLCFLAVISGSEVQAVLTDAVDASTLEGKFIFGYQGFFRRPGQGNDHWTLSGSIPGPSTPGDGKHSLSVVWPPTLVR